MIRMNEGLQKFSAHLRSCRISNTSMETSCSIYYLKWLIRMALLLHRVAIFKKSPTTFILSLSAEPRTPIKERKKLDELFSSNGITFYILVFQRFQTHRSSACIWPWPESILYSFSCCPLAHSRFPNTGRSLDSVNVSWASSYPPLNAPNPGLLRDNSTNWSMIRLILRNRCARATMSTSKDISTWNIWRGWQGRYHLKWNIHIVWWTTLKMYNLLNSSL